MILTNFKVFLQIRKIQGSRIYHLIVDLEVNIRKMFFKVFHLISGKIRVFKVCLMFLIRIKEGNLFKVMKMEIILFKVS